MRWGWGWLLDKIEAIESLTKDDLLLWHSLGLCRFGTLEGIMKKNQKEMRKEGIDDAMMVFDESSWERT